MIRSTVVSTPRGPVSYPYHFALVDFLTVAISNGWRLSVDRGRVALVEQ